MLIKLVVRTREGKEEFEYKGDSSVDIGDEFEVSGMTVVVKGIGTDADGEIFLIQAAEKEYDIEEESKLFITPDI